MGKRHGLTDFQEQAAACAEIQAVLAAVDVQRPARQILHDQEWPSVGGDAGVQEARDVGVLEVGQNLAFLAKAVEQLLGVETAADQLDGDLLANLIVVAHGQIHGSHAARADFANDAVGAHHDRRLGGERGDALDGPGDFCFRAGMAQQAEHCVMDLGCGRGDQLSTLRFGDFQSAVEELFNLYPIVRVHSPSTPGTESDGREHQTRNTASPQCLLILIPDDVRFHALLCGLRDRGQECRFRCELRRRLPGLVRLF